ncbi:hypothetical protein QE374_001928 [Microbacterium sp. SORGH_AS428]|uniref:hypothetical protein n=1 Tax=Microbacterium sp. SORGH_AS_0428 TaxID=3041788 RepID=UPI00286166F6|nr:hypothetical protein [Microbacterium sp. SORGH_AS_0428]MDR6200019.1 hypothetical protein [Microbacterium sp. SORGH_AS_0428]
MVTPFEFRRTPTPADLKAYRSLSEEERLQARLALAGKPQVNTAVAVSATALVVATMGFVPRLTAGWSLSNLVFVLVFCFAVISFAGMAVVFAGLDPQRTRRAWREAFDYVDAHHPPKARDTDPNRSLLTRWWRRLASKSAR